MWLNSDDLPITCRRLKIPVENRSLTGPVSSCSFERQHCTERCSTLLYNIRTIENNMNRKVRLKNCYPIWAERATAVCRDFRLSESLNLILCTALGANGEKYERNISSFFRSTLTIRWKKTTVNTTWCRTRPSVLGGRKSSVRLPQQRSSVCFWMVVTMELKEFSPVPVRSGGLAVTRFRCEQVLVEFGCYTARAPVETVWADPNGKLQISIWSFQTPIVSDGPRADRFYVVRGSPKDAVHVRYFLSFQ